MHTSSQNKQDLATLPLLARLLIAILLGLLVQEVLPHAEYYKRSGFPLKKIVKFASNRDFTDLIVFNEDNRQVRVNSRDKAFC